MRVHGMKVIYLTTGGLIDVLKQKYEVRSEKVCYEKSAEVIVLRATSCFKNRGLTTKEGLNFN